MPSPNIDELERQIARDSDDIRARLLLGREYMRAGRNMEAAALFRRVTELQPDHIIAWRWLGAVYGRARLYKEADAAYHAALYHAKASGPEGMAEEIQAALNVLPGARS